MDSNQIIRDEAKVFFEWSINLGGDELPIKDFHAIKDRLNDFYSAESKAMFLDEIELLMENDLQIHRNEKHGGKPEPSCGWEIKTEKLLFYIKQELQTLPIIAHQKHKTKGLRNKVFVSYSHFDKDFLFDIQRFFKPFSDKIDYWDDSKILPGQKWEEAIKDVIKETKVGILLVSTDFLGSDFILNNELPPLLAAAEEEGAVMLIVILKPCLFEDFPMLNQYQAMNSPSRPVSKMDQNEKDDFLVNLVKQTRRILDI
jgi:hypothetical protein